MLCLKKLIHSTGLSQRVLIRAKKHLSTSSKKYSDAEDKTSSTEAAKPIKSTSEQDPETRPVEIDIESRLTKYKLPDESIDIPKKHVFQQLTKVRTADPIYTLEEAAEYVPADSMIRYWKYPKLGESYGNLEYSLRSWDNERSVIVQFPDMTDVLIVGAGLIGSAVAYYIKRIASRSGDVVVIDKAPYSPNNCTAFCNGLISTQTKSQDIFRLATFTKELIRNLKEDILVTEEDYAQIKYRPCTHLVLWPEAEVTEVLKCIERNNIDGGFTEARLPHELEQKYPWLSVQNSDVSLGTHGNQDEAIIDPIGLRNLYRTLAQAHGANFILAEGLDFNTMYFKTSRQLSPMGAGAMVCRVGPSGELRNCGFAMTLLALGHNLPFLEARAEMEPEMRDSVEDLHFIQPRLRIYFSFNTPGTPVTDFPAITDTDGSVLIREDHAGNFKYYLTLEESETFFDDDSLTFMNPDADEPYQNLVHHSNEFQQYFDQVIKTRLVKRIPSMEDAKFLSAVSGFESYDTHDGSPIVSPHPFHAKVLLSGGFGSRMALFGPAAAAALSEIIISGEEQTFDMNNFYWDRVIRGRKIDEFESLVK